jgi:hypothetical protein
MVPCILFLHMFFLAPLFGVTVMTTMKEISQPANQPTSPPATSHQPQDTRHQPPTTNQSATSHQPPATSHHRHDFKCLGLPPFETQFKDGENPYFGAKNYTMIAEFLGMVQRSASKAGYIHIFVLVSHRYTSMHTHSEAHMHQIHTYAHMCMHMHAHTYTYT